MNNEGTSNRWGPQLQVITQMRLGTKTKHRAQETRTDKVKQGTSKYGNRGADVS